MAIQYMIGYGNLLPRVSLELNPLRESLGTRILTFAKHSVRDSLSAARGMWGSGIASGLLGHSRSDKMF